MHAPTLAQGARSSFEEPIESLLRQKSGEPPLSISPEATAYDAIERMAENHVGSLAVLSAGKLNGIITHRDCSRRVILEGKSRETRVHEIMSRSVYYVHPHSTIEECLGLMASHRVSHLAVVDDDDKEFIAMLSMPDLVNWIHSSLEK